MSLPLLYVPGHLLLRYPSPEAVSILGEGIDDTAKTVVRQRETEEKGEEGRVGRGGKEDLWGRDGEKRVHMTDRVVLDPMEKETALPSSRLLCTGHYVSCPLILFLQQVQ